MTGGAASWRVALFGSNPLCDQTRMEPLHSPTEKSAARLARKLPEGAFSGAAKHANEAA